MTDKKAARIYTVAAAISFVLALVLPFLTGALILFGFAFAVAAALFWKYSKNNPEPAKVKHDDWTNSRE